jgi:hypothetical protein
MSTDFTDSFSSCPFSLKILLATRAFARRRKQPPPPQVFFPGSMKKRYVKYQERKDLGQAYLAI